LAWHVSTPSNIKVLMLYLLEFLKYVLPDPGELGENYMGETSIGCRIKGLKDGKEKTYYVWNNCSHEKAYEETGTQAVSYTTGVPAMLGAMMVLTGKWKGKGVFNVEEFDPDPFMEKIGEHGLPWQEAVNVDLRIIMYQLNRHRKIPESFIFLCFLIFHEFGLFKIPSPAFVLDEKLLRKNLELIDKCSKRSRHRNYSGI
jgi:hypothetical protein